MAIEVLHSMAAVSRKADMDSVKNAKMHNGTRAFDVLLEAKQCWDDCARFRRDRARNKRYTYGDQWKDAVNVDGQEMSEEEYIRRQGNIPLKNNMIRRLVRNVTGVYRNQSKEPICKARDRDEQKIGEAMTTVLQYNMQLNRMDEMYARSMEEYLISGLIIHKKSFGWRNDKLDCWTDYVNPNNFFIDPNMRDFRGWDVSCIGEIHDVSFGALCEQFAESSEDYKRLSNIYRVARDMRGIRDTFQEFGFSNLHTYDFMYCRDSSLCRVIEVWRKESKPRYRCHDYNNGDVYKIDIGDYEAMVQAVNDDRITRGLSAGMPVEDIPLIEAQWFVDEYWYYYYLSPFGDILKEGETPYEHKSHPYVFKAYPFIDGEIHSFVSDVIDQQRYVNRLIMMYDWIMRASAKGVLLVPDSCLGDLSPEEFADTWSRSDGVIVYTPKSGQPLPTHISANSTNIGIDKLLSMQLTFFEDISGVHGALQGRTAASGVSGTLYSQQTQNATTSLLDILDSFSQFVKDAAYKDVKNIQQFYDTKRVINIAGKNGTQVVYDPQKIRDVEFDLSITESTTTPIYRQIANEFLMQIWQGGQITLQQLLKHGDFPFADELLQDLQSQQEQSVQNGVANNVLPAGQAAQE